MSQTTLIFSRMRWGSPTKDREYRLDPIIRISPHFIDIEIRNDALWIHSANNTANTIATNNANTTNTAANTANTTNSTNPVSHPSNRNCSSPTKDMSENTERTEKMQREDSRAWMNERCQLSLVLRYGADILISNPAQGQLLPHPLLNFTFRIPTLLFVNTSLARPQRSWDTVILPYILRLVDGMSPRRTSFPKPNPANSTSAPLAAWVWFQHALISNHALVQRTTTAPKIELEWCCSSCAKGDHRPILQHCTTSDSYSESFDVHLKALSSTMPAIRWIERLSSPSSDLGPDVIKRGSAVGISTQPWGVLRWNASTLQYDMQCTQPPPPKTKPKEKETLLDQKADRKTDTSEKVKPPKQKDRNADAKTELQILPPDEWKALCNCALQHSVGKGTPWKQDSMMWWVTHAQTNRVFARHVLPATETLEPLYLRHDFPILWNPSRVQLGKDVYLPTSEYRWFMPSTKQ